MPGQVLNCEGDEENVRAGADTARRGPHSAKRRLVSYRRMIVRAERLPILMESFTQSKLMLQKCREIRRLMYATRGHGDVIGTWRHWKEGRDDPGQVAMTYSGQFYDVCRELGAKGYAIASASRLAGAGGGWGVSGGAQAYSFPAGVGAALSPGADA